MNEIDKAGYQPYHFKVMVYKRAKFLINKKFQLKFAFFVCSWIFALSMIYPILIYNLFEYFVHAIQDPSTAHAYNLTADKIKELEKQVLFLLGILQLVFLSITFVLSIFISHRIAGPVYRIRKALEEVGRGNFDQRVTLRKTDHFHELQDTFNEMIQHLSIRRWR
ncbi:MAG: HAMP domain-containing protein [Bacteriovoracia bacterium]